MDTHDSFLKLIQFFEEFPGVGARQARRFSLFLMLKNKEFVHQFSETIINARSLSKECDECMRHHFGTSITCPLCNNTQRSPYELLVVEKEQDIDSFEKTHIFQGKYFVLGNLISLVSKNELKLSRFEKLLMYLKRHTELTEIILAFSLTPNGNFTDSYLKTEIKKRFPNLRVVSLGRGLATGSDPEYTDPDTLISALKTRR